MSNPFFDHPILNSPYEYPNRHWELGPTGQPTDWQIFNKVVKRKATLFLALVLLAVGCNARKSTNPLTIKKAFSTNNVELQIEMPAAISLGEKVPIRLVFQNNRGLGITLYPQSIEVRLYDSRGLIQPIELSNLVTLIGTESKSVEVIDAVFAGISRKKTRRIQTRESRDISIDLAVHYNLKPGLYRLEIVAPVVYKEFLGARDDSVVSLTPKAIEFDVLKN
ncbi:MAG: hypothetical protein J0M24_03805 [Verrucomicrobia bacterium]|nr:hypothetical protein [Verrucomicrobiota bacterium]